MSKRISGSSGGSSSFGGGSSGGSRSFGGSHGGGPRKLSDGSSSGYGSGFEGAGLGVAEGLAELAYNLLGLPGLLITIFALVVVFLLIKYPVVGGITFATGTILFCVIYAIVWKKREPEIDLVELIGQKEKYSKDVLESGGFYMYMMAELRDKNLLTKKGNLDQSKIDQAIESFDDIYRSYVRSHPYIKVDMDVDEIRQMKKEYRKHFRALRDELSEGEVKAYSREICRKITALPEFQEADAVLSYMAFRNEVDCNNIMLTAWRMGKKVFLPRMEGEEMEFHLVGPQDPLITNSFGIDEPDPSFPNLPEVMPKGSRILMVMPGLAYDRARHRLGYGGGYYDRYLSGFGNEYRITTVAPTYSTLILQDGELPFEETDIRPQLVIDECR